MRQRGDTALSRPLLLVPCHIFGALLAQTRGVVDVDPILFYKPPKRALVRTQLCLHYQPGASFIHGHLIIPTARLWKEALGLVGST
jgi:hypothetical protein